MAVQPCLEAKIFATLPTSGIAIRINSNNTLSFTQINQSSMGIVRFKDCQITSNTIPTDEVAVI